VEADNGVAQTAAAQEMLPAPPQEYVLFFRRQYRLLMAYVMHAGADQAEADDLTADTLTSMLKRWDEIKDPVAWARSRVVRNLINLRKSEKARLVRQGKHLASTFERPPDPADVWADPAAVDDLLGLLTDSQRAVVEHLRRGLDQNEIAELLGKSYEAVRRSLSDIRKRLGQQRPRTSRKATMSTSSAVRKEAR